MAISKANTLWKAALRDPLFVKKIDLLTAVTIPDFSICATVLLSQFEKELCSIVIATGADEVDEFAMLIDLGFFVRTEQRYQMVIPSQLNIAKVKRAALRLANIGEKRYVNPSCFLATMPQLLANKWQHCFRKMGESRRCARRQALLETVQNSSKARGPSGARYEAACHGTGE